MPEPKERVEVTITDTTAQELQRTVDALPRTEGMTLPAIIMAEIDEETLNRMEMYSRLNEETDPNAVVNKETGHTLAETRNLFEFGVANADDELPEGAGKHVIKVTEDSHGRKGISVIPPSGDEKDVTPIVATPPNISPIDVDAPHNPVEAKEAAGLPADAPTAPAPPTGGMAPVLNTPVPPKVHPSDFSSSTPQTPETTRPGNDKEE